MLTSLLSPVAAQSLPSEATDAYYALQPGEGLEEVALRFGLDLRTVRCANPDWKPGQTRVAAPLTSSLRHSLTTNHDQTLAEIARLYQVEIGVITDFPLNYWEGCPGEAGMGGKLPGDQPAAGSMLYIPVLPARATAAQPRLNFDPANPLPAGSQAQVDPYLAEEDPLDALVNPYPLPFKLPELLAKATPAPATNSPVPNPVATATPKKPPNLPAASVTTPAVNQSGASSLPARTSTAPLATPTAREAQPTATPVPAKPDPTATPQAVAPPPPPANGKAIIWPIRGVITTYFSAAHPGIDIATKAGTPILAVQSGRVFYAAWSPYGYGNFVKIDHGDGRETHYAHLSSFAVQSGQMVAQGQVVGYEGSTGNSTGPHLHFELVVSGRYVNPLQYLGS